MKIILTGLGMRSEPMDWPENSTPTVRVALAQPLTVLSRYEHVPETLPLQTVCEFEWTGKMDQETGARIYSLSDITKY